VGKIIRVLSCSTYIIECIEFHAFFIICAVQVIEDIHGSLQAEEAEPPTRLGLYSADCEDLWSPKKIQPYIFPETCGKKKKKILYGTV
jgi:hypothetical protein